MKLIKHRPTVRLRLPAEIHPGEKVRVETVIDAKRPVGVDAITAEVNGNEECTVGSGKSSRTYRKHLVRLKAGLSGPREIPTGRTTIPWHFTLPEDAPPSYDGRRAETQYGVSIRLDIPWWPDRSGCFVAQVTYPPIAAERSTPQVFSTHPSGSSGGEPHVECSLESQTLVPGAELRGSIALFNVAANDYRKLVLTLVARESRRDTSGVPRGTALEAHRFQYEIPLTDPIEGDGIPFHLRLPEAMPISFQSHLWSLSWTFEAKATLDWRRDVTLHVPLMVVPKGSQLPAPDRYAIRTVGSERIQQIWQQVAAELEMKLDGSTLWAKRGAVRVAVQRDHRGRDGTFLVAKLRFPSLHLHLDGGLASGFHRLVGAGLKIGADDWDRRHYVTGRESAQIRAFFRPLKKLLASQTVSDLDDEHMVLELRDAGQTKSPLAKLATAALRFADAIPAARAAIPPPSVMKEALPTWQALAKRLGGPLETARMAVQGRFEGAKVEVWTDWSADDRAERTALVLHLGFPVEDDHRLTWCRGTWTAGELQQLPGLARAFVPQLLAGATGLEIARERIELSVAAPLMDGMAALDHLHRLTKLAGLLRGKAGPYR
ncbi:MAG: sporulation protein [Deltaproteobacteria bacterium]|nr:sporulation protein [Deltaproteobacteria bacterium]MBW2536087.1 sporulation protein [Deltaproteobacteria bacterium]